jgi:hypothetical protein
MRWHIEIKRTLWDRKGYVIKRQFDWTLLQNFYTHLENVWLVSNLTNELCMACIITSWHLLWDGCRVTVPQCIVSIVSVLWLIGTFELHLLFCDMLLHALKSLLLQVCWCCVFDADRCHITICVGAHHHNKLLSDFRKFGCNGYMYTGLPTFR